MKKLSNSDFYMIKDILEGLDIDYNLENQNRNNVLAGLWNEFIGEKISKIAKFHEMSKDNTLVIVCADSYVANELYYNKEKILNFMVEKAEKLGIKIKDIIFNYKKWKENNNE